MSAEAAVSGDGTSSLPPSMVVRFQAKSPEAAEEFVAFLKEAKEKIFENPTGELKRPLETAMRLIAPALENGLELTFEADGDLVIIKANATAGNESERMLDMIKPHIPEIANLGTVILKVSSGFSFDDFLAGDLNDGMKLSGEANISTAACAAAIEKIPCHTHQLLNFKPMLLMLIKLIAGADFKLTLQHDKFPSAKTAAVYKAQLYDLLARELNWGDSGGPGLDAVISEKLAGIDSLDVVGGPASLRMKFESFRIFSLLSLKPEKK